MESHHSSLRYNAVSGLNVLTNVTFLIEPFGLSMVISPTKPFLHRCRTLKKLKMHSAAPETFQWAVREREQYDGNLHNGIIPEPLVPLESIRISSYTHSRTNILDDAAFAFNNTLKSLYFNHGFRTNLDPTSDFNTGQGWILPKLQYLCIIIGDNALYVHPDLFSNSPDLEHIELRDCTNFSALAKARSWPPVELPYLKTLNLCGIPAMSFHPGTFYSTPSLQVLSLALQPASGDELLGTMDATAAQEAPPMSPHPRVRTWDWHLPMLTKLVLEGIFALQFQFRTLHGCPSLKILCPDKMNFADNGLSDSAQTLMLVDPLDAVGAFAGQNRRSKRSYISTSPKTPWIQHLRDVLHTFFHIIAPNIVSLQGLISKN